MRETADTALRTCDRRLSLTLGWGAVTHAAAGSQADGRVRCKTVPLKTVPLHGRSNFRLKIVPLKLERFFVGAPFRSFSCSRSALALKSMTNLFHVLFLFGLVGTAGKRISQLTSLKNDALHGHSSDGQESFGNLRLG